MERLTYVTDDGTVLFTPLGTDPDTGYTITGLAAERKYAFLEEIAQRLANWEQAYANWYQPTNHNRNKIDSALKELEAYRATGLYPYQIREMEKLCRNMAGMEEKE